MADLASLKLPKGLKMNHPNGHSNQAGGCCCPTCGNTCGFCPEFSRPEIPAGFDTLAEYLVSQPVLANKGIGTLAELAASSAAWAKRLSKLGKSKTAQQGD